jgi:hypothetical protein
MACLSEKS